MDEKLKALCKKHDIDGKWACWQHKQSKKWILRHEACELLASYEGITIGPPNIIGVNTETGWISLWCSGVKGEASEWTIGEACPQTSMNKYYGAMAEKRAKDRIILKLLNLHGSVYSDIEADDFKKPEDINPITVKQPNELNSLKIAEADMKEAISEECEEWYQSLITAHDIDSLKGLGKEIKEIKFNDREREYLLNAYHDKMDLLNA